MPLQHISGATAQLVDTDGVGGHKLAVSLYMSDGVNGGAVPLAGKYEEVALPSAARTTSTASADLSNASARGALVIFNVTANPGGSENLSFQIEAKDPVSGSYAAYVSWNNAISAANGLRFLAVGPGVSSVPNLGNGFALVLPKTFRVRVVHSGAGSWTYSAAIVWIN